MSDPNELTIADIARLANVSVSTVSRILNGKQDVAPATRERVQRLIDELGYIPHAQAQRLRAGKTRTLALLYPQYTNKPINQNELDFMIGAAAAAGEKNFFFNLITKPVTKRDLLGFYNSAQFDGLILMQIHLDDWRVELLREQGYPFVMIGHCANNEGLIYIDVDFEAFINKAFDYLVELGHRNIAYVGLSSALRQQGFGPAIRTFWGYEQAVHKHGLESVYCEATYSVEEVFASTLALLDEHPELTAIVTPHDTCTVGILRALAERGRFVPDDFSLVAIMMKRQAEISTPPITAINFPSYDIAYQAVQMLINQLEHRPIADSQILISPRLVIRESTQPLHKSVTE